MRKRVVVAMSGGVDSSVAAAILKSKGFEVIGITMCFNLPDVASRKPACCGLQGIEDARRVCHTLGIKHYVLNFSRILEDKIIKNFCQEYLRGRTPNPCVRCNQYIKFDALLKKALSLNADYLATGHYARVTRVHSSPHPSSQERGSQFTPPLLAGAGFTVHPAPPRRSGVHRYALKKAKDKTKDQSYFLYRLTQGQLKHILFPLGNYTKAQVRKIAKKMGLPVADKPGSQEICFLPDNDYRTFLTQRASLKYKNLQPGPIVNMQGEILGYHKGTAFYTVGQREGLGIALGYPVYVIRIDAKDNRLIAGSKEEACAKSFLVDEPHWIVTSIENKIAASVKIRYNCKEEKAVIQPFKDALKATFFKPQFAITPGQSAVFYLKGTILGGGIISRVLD